MTKRRAQDTPPSRAELEKQLSADMRAITSQSDRIGRRFARLNGVSSSDFHALLHIMVGETAGTPLTLAQLRQRMEVSPAAITYLVDRMIDVGHIRREPDPDDRRKWLLRYEESGMALARDFFGPLGDLLNAALADLSDRDLLAAHRVFTAMIAAMSTFEDERRQETAG
ncbi:MarR family winged helix-turn-helix transcriptional regulator [Mycobacterium sp. 1245805.9]|uniref:MarR family winged helix-turn-helix transcriptional regulator n=1 Tax=Mycobacterium sp. 1245805.9 TaxID=1856862 RepID=UPI000801E007|nr:MarR family transcriptional regulator [Mycobacterium sp. 1245805.9]OBI87112.1 MarR family transcriptional regulator [Mycobacterium sp. 1245805.9]